MKRMCARVVLGAVVIAGSLIAARAEKKEPEDKNRPEEGPVIVLPSTPTVRESGSTVTGTGSGYAIVPAGSPIGAWPVNAAQDERQRTERRVRKLIRRLYRAPGGG